MCVLQERNLGPGTYNPDVSDFDPKAVQERAKGPGWRRAQEKPGLLYREAWDNKHLLVRVEACGVVQGCVDGIGA